MRLLTTEKERKIRMTYGGRTVSRRTRIVFPVAVTMVVGILVPFATPLVGSLMLGNLMRESLVVERLTHASANEIANVVTLFLGLAIGSTMVGETFLLPSTLAILVLGILAFALDSAAGDRSSPRASTPSRGGTFNPLIGAAGISAFPMAARVVQRVAQEEDFENFPLMHAMGANAAGQVASVVAGGVLLALTAAVLIRGGRRRRPSGEHARHVAVARPSRPRARRACRPWRGWRGRRTPGPGCACRP